MGVTLHCCSSFVWNKTKKERVKKSFVSVLFVFCQQLSSLCILLQCRCVSVSLAAMLFDEYLFFTRCNLYSYSPLDIRAYSSDTHGFLADFRHHQFTIIVSFCCDWNHWMYVAFLQQFSVLAECYAEFCWLIWIGLDWAEFNAPPESGGALNSAQSNPIHISQQNSSYPTQHRSFRKRTDVTRCFFCSTSGGARAPQFRPFLWSQRRYSSRRGRCQ